jgi:hypothetical protein
MGFVRLLCLAHLPPPLDYYIKMPDYLNDNRPTFAPRRRSTWHSKHRVRGMPEKRRLPTMESKAITRPRVFNYPAPPERPFARSRAPTPIPHRVHSQHPVLNARPGTYEPWRQGDARPDLATPRPWRYLDPRERRRMEVIPLTTFPNPNYQFEDPNPALHRRHVTLIPADSLSARGLDDLPLPQIIPLPAQDPPGPEHNRRIREHDKRAKSPAPKRVQDDDFGPRAFDPDTTDKLGNVTRDEKSQRGRRVSRIPLMTTMLLQSRIPCTGSASARRHCVL